MRFSLFAIVFTLLLGGCSSTWEGVKQDSSDIWNSTKETIHDATE
ncbi:hypothetical protein [Marinomonas fungiae]|uniref:Entericidin EcnA/B family n=1 Tax=Marinomonas fungiae TaxID=1137284 RepID=A0A0K6IKI6_9GAMM|nr:hypothetical protein [Marinomonas fungiae]CUB03581.1 hypothetical protein Ga0061065_10412 [Marinomonas fungiae]